MNKYFSLIIFIILLNNNHLFAQEYSDAEIKTAYTYNFGKFTEWENEKDIDTFRIGVYGEDSTIYFIIKKMSQIRLLKGKPISVFYFTELKNISNVHILYVNNESNFEIAEIFQKIQGNNTLLVTDWCEEQKSIMINFLATKGVSIPFEINKKNIADENLILSPEILLIGGNEIDIRELYKEKEKELQTEKEKVEEREIEIKKQNKKLQGLSDNVIIINKELIKKQILISEQQEEIKEQNNNLLKLLSEITEKKKNLDSKIKILEKQEIEINNKQEDIDIQKQEIKTQSTILKSQKDTITSHQNKIKNQKSILNTQLSKIKTQRLLLYLFIAFIILTLGLVFFIYRGYKIKKETNKKLEEKNTSITKQNIQIHQQKEEIQAQSVELKKLSIVASETDNAIIITDVNGNIECINEGFTRLYGCTFDQLIEEKGKTLINSSSNPDIKDIFDKCILDKKSIIYESLSKCKSGKSIWTQTTLKPILDKSSNVVKLIAIDSDITKLKEAEDEILKKNEEILTQNEELEIHRNHLEELIKKRTSELEKAKIKAEESDRLKSAFLTNMSHEIRTPMNGILGFAGLLKEPNLTGKMQQEYIRIIEKSGDRMLNIINDIIDISKIESGLNEITIINTNINEQIEYIYSFFTPSVEEKRLKFSFIKSLPANEVNINTDKEKFLKILTNLIKNAIKFTDKGSIEFGYEKKGNYLEFFVKDTGIGIPHNRQEAIFERFIQADILDSRAFQGAGLGLSITKAYVEMLGGKIWVNSEEENLPNGKTGGSIFYFTIPYNTEPEEKNIIKNIESVYQAKNQIMDIKLLIVEDDEISSQFLTEIVCENCKEIIYAKDGSEAVYICKNNNDIDLILMDIKMSKLDGYEATKQIRLFNKDIVIIAQTAYGLIGDEEKAIEAGCNYHISKPIDKTLLINLIKDAF